jgi:hypothetical protein
VRCFWGRVFFKCDTVSAGSPTTAKRKYDGYNLPETTGRENERSRKETNYIGNQTFKKFKSVTK